MKQHIIMFILERDGYSKHNLDYCIKEYIKRFPHREDELKRKTQQLQDSIHYEGFNPSSDKISIAQNAWKTFENYLDTIENV